MSWPSANHGAPGSPDMNHGRYGSPLPVNRSISPRTLVPAPASFRARMRSGSDPPRGAAASASSPARPSESWSAAGGSSGAVSPAGESSSGWSSGSLAWSGAGAWIRSPSPADLGLGASSRVPSPARTADGWFSGNCRSRSRRLSSNSAGGLARPSGSPGSPRSPGASWVSANERSGGRSLGRMSTIVLPQGLGLLMFWGRRCQWRMSCTSKPMISLLSGHMSMT